MDLSRLYEARRKLDRLIKEYPYLSGDSSEDEWEETLLENEEEDKDEQKE
jgi:hypothetical protein